jgi:hypothetical protein
METKRGRGRQVTSPDGTKRERVLRVRLSTAEWAEIERRARLKKMDLSAYVRTMTLGA